MKHFLFILVAFLLSAPVFAQYEQIGIDHVIADAYIGAGDSAHYIGSFSPRFVGSSWVDSSDLVVAAEDTMNWSLRATITNSFGQTEAQKRTRVDTATLFAKDSVGGFLSSLGGLKVIPYWKIRTAIQAISENYSKALPPEIDVWLIVDPTGSAMGSRGKKFRVYQYPYPKES